MSLSSLVHSVKLARYSHLDRKEGLMNGHDGYRATPSPKWTISRAGKAERRPGQPFRSLSGGWPLVAGRVGANPEIQLSVAASRAGRELQVSLCNPIVAQMQ